MKNVSKRVALCGMLVALAFILSYIEMLIPFSFVIPGVKLGLANLVVLSCIYFLSPQEVLIILVARIFLAGFLFGNMSSIIYSLAGGLLSFVVMLFVRKKGALSMTGVSIAGGISHNIGQIALAVIAVDNTKILAYLPVLLVSGAVTGTMVGMIAKNVLGKLNKAGYISFQTIEAKSSKKDWILAAGVFGIAIISGLFLHLITRQEGQQIKITVDGVEYGTYDLNAETSLEISNGYGSNHVKISGGQVSIIEADCRDQICVNHAPIKKNYETIVCLPHKLVIEVLGKSGVVNEMDAISN